MLWVPYCPQEHLCNLAWKAGFVVSEIENFSLLWHSSRAALRVFILVCNSHFRREDNTPYCASSICRTSSAECRRSLLGPDLYCKVVLVSVLHRWGCEKSIPSHRNHIVKVLSGKDINPWSFLPSSAVKMNGHLQTISILSNQNIITSCYFQSPSLPANLINYHRQVFFNKRSLHSLFFSSLLLELMKLQWSLWNNGAISITAGWREKIRDGNWGGAGGEAVEQSSSVCAKRSLITGD